MQSLTRQLDPTRAALAEMERRVGRIVLVMDENKNFDDDPNELVLNVGGPAICQGEGGERKRSSE